MASSPITSWQIDGETMGKVADFIFLGSKITADGDFSYEIKRCLLLGRKVMTNLDSILKSKDMSLQTKFHLVKAIVFPVVMYGYEHWNIKKTECWWIDAFELWGCWGSDTTEQLHFHALEKEMATHSSVLAWRVPGTGEPGGLLSMGSHRVGHDWSDLATACRWLHSYGRKWRKTEELDESERGEWKIWLKAQHSEN